MGLRQLTVLPTQPFVNAHSGAYARASSQYVTYGNGADETGDNAFSISAWVKSGTPSYDPILNNYGSNGAGWGLYLINGLISVFFFAYNAGAIQAVSNTNGWDDGNWHHIVMTYDGSRNQTGLKLYGDGALLAVTNYEGPTVEGSLAGWSTIKTGWALGGLNYLNGNLDEVSKWPIQLTSSNVTELYNGGTPTNIETASFFTSSGFATSVRSMWLRFENTWNDSSPNLYVGTPVNSPTFSTDVP